MTTRIMVVDDEEDYRIILHDVLENAGYEVGLANNGKDALARLDEFRPALIITDWLMPQMDGPALVRNLRGSAAYKNIPIIMLTIRQTTDDELEALHIGADDFIAKPFQTQDLLSRLGAILRRTSTGINQKDDSFPA